jgi:hypothetical protein
LLCFLETPGITAVVTYKFDLSTVGYHQAIPEQTMTWILNSAEDGDGPNIIKASVHSEGGNHDPSEVLSVNCQTGRAPGSTLPGKIL